MQDTHAVVRNARLIAVLLLSEALFVAAQTKPAGGGPPPRSDVRNAAVQTPTPEAPTAPEAQSLHVQVGRSVVISTQARLRRILVSNQAVLETATITPTQLAVTAKAPGSSSLVMWDESGHARILDVYADIDVGGLRDAVRQSFPDEPVQIEPDQGRVVLTGTVRNKAVADEVMKLAANYSKEVVSSLNIAPQPRIKQVMLKVRFAEVDRTKLQQLGINFFSTGAANTPGTVSTQQFSAPTGAAVTGVIGSAVHGTSTTFNVTDLLNISVFRPDLNLGATIKALEQKNVLEILAEPNLMARSGEPARFLAGGEFPFPVVQGGQNVNAITIQFRPFGVRLDFTGTIEDNNVIRLKVAPEVSALDFANAVTISGFVVPALSTRRAETEIELVDGQSFGIAGLLDQRTTAQLSKIPGIGDIPVLGNLFKSRQMNRTNTELLVLVTPSIIDPVAQSVAAPPLPAMPLSFLGNKQFDRDVSKGKPAAQPGKQ